MNRDLALRTLRDLRPLLEGRGVAHAGLFGSMARDDANIQSDVDIVITPRQGRKLDLVDLGGIQSLLESAFGGRPIDLVSEPVSSSILQRTLTQDRVDAF